MESPGLRAALVQAGSHFIRHILGRTVIDAVEAFAGICFEVKQIPLAATKVAVLPIPAP